jgi:antirestriction protein ArdC
MILTQKKVLGNKRMSKLIEERKKIVEDICKQLEKGVIPWEADWERFSNAPVNAVTGNRYRGGNSLRLSFVAHKKGYDDPRWCTFLQAKEQGWKIKAGSKSAVVEFYSPPKEEDIKRSEAGEDIPKEKLYPVVKLYNVFNAQDIEGIPPLIQKTFDPIEIIEKAERILAESGAVIKHSGSRAFYKPSTDEITMPPKELFYSTEGYYSTALHELGHWTGHESRLNRFSSEAIDSKKEYAKEELRAELASVFVGSETGIKLDDEHFLNHAAYLGSWLKALRNDPNELFRAANEADKISEYILQYERKRELMSTIIENNEVMIEEEKEMSNGSAEVRPASKIQMELVARMEKALNITIPEGISDDSRKTYKWLDNQLKECSNRGITLSEKTSEGVIKTASERQSAFMKDIEKATGLVIPEKAFCDSKEANKYIKEGIKYCKENGIEIGKSKKASEYEAKEATNNQLKYMQSLAEASGQAIPEEAYLDSVKASDYIKNTLNFCEENNISIVTEKQSIISIAREALGQGSFVTNAQNNATYEGNIVAASDNYAVQKVLDNKGILHELGNNLVLKALLGIEENKDMSLKIIYKDGEVSVGKTTDKEKGIELEEGNEY